MWVPRSLGIFLKVSYIRMRTLNLCPSAFGPHLESVLHQQSLKTFCSLQVAVEAPRLSFFSLFLPPTQPQGWPRSCMPLPPWRLPRKGCLVPIGTRRWTLWSKPPRRQTVPCCFVLWAVGGQRLQGGLRCVARLGPQFPLLFFHFVDHFGQHSEDSAVPLEPIIFALPTVEGCFGLGSRYKRDISG